MMNWLLGRFIIGLLPAVLPGVPTRPVTAGEAGAGRGVPTSWLETVHTPTGLRARAAAILQDGTATVAWPIDRQMGDRVADPDLTATLIRRLRLPSRQNRTRGDDWFDSYVV